MMLKKFKPSFSPSTGLIVFFAAVKFGIHMLTAVNYGFFCDELYTIALSKHLAFGYVDLPPLAPALMALGRAVLGESQLAYAVIPALAGAGTLVFVCLITLEFGGGLFAVGVSALAFIIVPLWLIMDSFFCYDCIDQFFLAAFLYLLVVFLRTGNKKIWLALGLAAGLACLSKTTILYYGPGFLAALLIGRYRKHLLTPWPWMGAAIFLLVVSPYVYWEISNQWPTLEFWGHYSSAKVTHYSIGEYFINISLNMNPLLIPLLVIGLYRIFRPLRNHNASFCGILFLTTAILLFAVYARIFMLAALFIPLISAGAVFIEEKLEQTAWKQKARFAVAAYLVLGGLLVAPCSLPILPEEWLPAYAHYFGFLYQPIKDFNYAKSDYPQEFSNRIGWDELVQSVAEVYHALPPEDQKKAGIYADWYGPAGAIDYYGPQYGLPHAVSGHMNYFLWGPGYSWEVMILVTSNIKPFYNFFAYIDNRAFIINHFAMPWNHLSVYVVREPQQSLNTIWSNLKYYY